jgi:glutamine---fructose-6-phosphate transaminase (isomerizing)
LPKIGHGSSLDSYLAHLSFAATSRCSEPLIYLNHAVIIAPTPQMISLSPATNPYLSDLLDQPVALQNTLNSLADTHAIEPYAQRLASGELHRVLLTGMGSSYHALHPLHLTLLAHGLTSFMMETSELIHYAPTVLDARTIVIAVSQSGRSAEMIKLLADVKGCSPVIGITNTADGPLAQQADAVLLTHAGIENTVSCKTYISTLAALAVLGNVLTGKSANQADVIADLSSAIPFMANYLAQWPAHVERLITLLADARHLIIAGRGTSLAAVGTGGLTTKESAHFPTEGLSAAGFRHGPFELISPSLFVAVLAGDERTQALNSALVADVEAEGGQAVLIGEDQPEAVFNLPTVPAIARPLLEILPLQMMTLALAHLNNHDAGNFTRATKVTDTE